MFVEYAPARLLLKYEILLKNVPSSRTGVKFE